MAGDSGGEVVQLALRGCQKAQYGLARLVVEDLQRLDETL